MYLYVINIQSYLNLYIMYFYSFLIISVGGLQITNSGLSITEWELLKEFTTLHIRKMEYYFSFTEIPQFKIL